MIGQASAIVEPISAVIGAILALHIKNILPIIIPIPNGKRKGKYMIDTASK